MALSGSSTKVFTNNSSFSLVLNWSGTQSISNNTTNITATLSLKSNQSWGSVNDATASATSITIDGNTSSANVTSTIGAYATKRLMSHSRTVGHDAVGNKSVGISGSHYFDITWNGGWVGTVTTSGSWALNNIPRISKISVNPTSVNLGTPTTINIARQSNSFTHSLSFNYRGKKVFIASKTGSTSISYTPKVEDFADLMNDKLSDVGIIICDTFNGSSMIGSSQTNLTIKIPNVGNTNYDPEIESVIITENNPTVANIMAGTYVQTMSSLKIETSVKYKYSSREKESTITIAGKTYKGSSITTDTISVSGTSNVVVTIKDSRGLTASKTIPISVLPYSPPKMINFTASRNDINQSKADYIATAKTTALLNKNDKMNLKVELFKPETNSWTLIYNSGNSLSTENWTTGNRVQEGLDIARSYQMRATISDNFSSSSAIQELPTITVPMSWGQVGAGVGTIYKEGGATLQVGGGIALTETLWGEGIGEALAGLDLNNSNLIKANGMFFNDVADVGRNEGFIFPKSNYKEGDTWTYGNSMNFLFDKDGDPRFNGRYIGQELWSGAYFMNGNQTITLSANLSECFSGIVLHWSTYANGTANNYDYVYHFIPKSHPLGVGVHVPLAKNDFNNQTATKYLYIGSNGNQIVGHNWNESAVSNKWVLRRVLYV